MAMVVNMARVVNTARVVIYGKGSNYNFIIERQKKQLNLLLKI